MSILCQFHTKCSILLNITVDSNANDMNISNIAQNSILFAIHRLLQSDCTLIDQYLMKEAEMS
jgi:hypothetical protein